jgi:anthranilate 1,2-dioxygenase large subunit
VVFGTYSQDTPDLETYLTPEIVDEFDVTFSGKKLKVLGYYRNELPCNWKMYHENLKDPYHATLLHSFLTVFGLLVPGIKAQVFADTVLGRHGFMASAKPDQKYATVAAEDKAEMRSFDENLRLRDERFLDFVKEFKSPWSATMMTIWPNLIVQREMNTLGVRQIIPNGPHSMVMQWTMFGYEDDTPEMTRHRLRQGNLMGPAGFLGLEDNEALKFVQEGLRRSTTDNNVLKLDSQQLGTTRGLISESCIRSLYAYYRDIMDIRVAEVAA